MADLQMARGLRLHAVGPFLVAGLLAQVPYRVYYIATRRPGAGVRAQRVFTAIGAALGLGMLANWLLKLLWV